MEIAVTVLGNDNKRRQEAMPKPKFKIAGVAIALGIVAFHCQWLYFIDLEKYICFDLVAWWLRPVLLAVIAGATLAYFYYTHYKMIFVALMLPSVVTRQISFFFMSGGPGNLWPLFFAADLFLLGLVGLVMSLSAHFGRKRSHEE